MIDVGFFLIEKTAGSNQYGKKEKNDLSGREMLSQWKESQSQAVELDSLSHALLQQSPLLPHVDYEIYLRQTFSNHK